MKISFKFGLTLSALLVILLVSGCGTIKNITGKGKNPPDEFAVVQRPSLVIPPDFSPNP